MPHSITGVYKYWDSPDPRQGPESPFPGKEGFGVQKLPFPLVLEKGGFCQKIPFFLQGNTSKMGIFGPKTPFSGLCKGEGKWGFLDPETLFSRKWGFGPLSGVGGIPIQVVLTNPSVFAMRLVCTLLKEDPLELAGRSQNQCRPLVKMQGLSREIERHRERERERETEKRDRETNQRDVGR